MAGVVDNNNAERLVKIELDDPAGPRRSAEAEQERAIAIDILEENQFGVPEHVGPFHLYLKLEGRHVHFDIRNPDDIEIAQFFMAMVHCDGRRDYFHVCDTYYDAIRPNHHRKFRPLIWASGLHNEGSDYYSRDNGKVMTDFKTARRLFTLVVYCSPGEMNKMSARDIGDIVPPRWAVRWVPFYLPATSMLCVLQWPKPVKHAFPGKRLIMRCHTGDSRWVCNNGYARNWPRYERA